MASPENYIHGLSQIEFHRGSGRDLPAWSRAPLIDQDHVASLDGLALLFVFRAKGDVVATSYWQTANKLILLWAKNEPVDDLKQFQYIEELLSNVKQGTDAADLLNIVIPMCREKIFHRVKKLAKSFDESQTGPKREKSNLWQFDETKEPHQRLEAGLREAGWLEEHESVIEKLDDFTRFVDTVTKASEVEAFWQIIYFSCCVTSAVNLGDILARSQFRYLSKLGDYARILKRLPLLLKKVDKAKITVEQVMTCFIPYRII
jgi:hypothetical protein